MEGENRFAQAQHVMSDGPKPALFIVSPRLLGLPPGLSYDCVAELLERLEGERQEPQS